MDSIYADVLHADELDDIFGGQIPGEVEQSLVFEEPVVFNNKVTYNNPTYANSRVNIPYGEAAINPTSGAMVVTGGVGVGGDVHVAGSINAGSVTYTNLTVTGSATIGSTLGVSGLSTLAGISDSGGLTESGLIASSNTTDSTTTGTGAIVTAGGVGIAKNLTVGGSINAGAVTYSSLTVTGATITAGITDSGGFNETNTTNSTSGSTGAIHTAGGVGIAKDLFVGGNATLSAFINASLTNNNFAMGSGSLQAAGSLLYDGFNTAIGIGVMSVYSPTGPGRGYNTGVGYGALSSITGTGGTNSNNTGLGALAGGTITTGYNNTCIGATAGNSLTSGYNNTVIGAVSGGGVILGNDNMILGYNTLGGGFQSYACKIGSNCRNTDSYTSSVGYSSLNSVTTGGTNSYNSGIGYQAGGTGTNHTGTSYLTLLGSKSDINANNLTQTTVIGANAVGTASNQIMMGTSSERVQIPGTEASTSTTTGALRVAGGAGIGGDLYVGGGINAGAVTYSSLTVTGATVTAGITDSGGFNETNTTDTTSGSTGAIHTAGGIGITKALFVGTSATIGTTLGVSGLSTLAGISDSGGITESGAVNVTNTTNATSTTTGAIKTAGGLGVAQDIYAGTMIRSVNSSAQSTTGGGMMHVIQDDGSAVSSGNRLGTFSFLGTFDNTHTYNVGAGIRGFATENWTSTNNGTQIVVQTTPNGSTTRTTALTLDQNQNTTCAKSLGVGVAPTNTVDITRPSAATSGALTYLTVTPKNDTGLTASTNVPLISTTAATRQWATGAQTLISDVFFAQPTYTAVGATATSFAATVAINGAPVQGTNQTITTSAGLYVVQQAVTGAGNGLGILCYASTNAGSSNACAAFMGLPSGSSRGVGIGTVTPSASLQITRDNVGAGNNPYLRITPVGDTGSTASTEFPILSVEAGNRTWSTGSLTLQRSNLIAQNTVNFVGASTVTDTAALGIAGPNIAGTNATATNVHGLLIGTGSSVGAATTNAYGMTVNTPTGATNNFSAQFLGSPTLGVNFSPGYSTTATAAGTTTLTVNSNYIQDFTGSTTQTCVLPVVSTLKTGLGYKIKNHSSGNVTVNSSGGNTLATLTNLQQLVVECISTSGTGTASWSWTVQTLGG